MNNFQRLQQETEEDFYSQNKNGLEENLLGTFSTYRFIGNVIDVYVPRVVDLFIAIAGGEIENSSKSVTSKNRDRRDPASGAISREQPKGPGE